MKNNYNYRDMEDNTSKDCRDRADNSSQNSYKDKAENNNRNSSKKQ